MDTINISQVALLIFWFAFALLLFVLALIARFYESKSNQPTYYRMYAIPVLSIGAATVRYASINQWGDDPPADILMGGGGVILIGLCLHLYRTMTNGKK